MPGLDAFELSDLPFVHVFFQLPCAVFVRERTPLYQVIDHGLHNVCGTEREGEREGGEGRERDASTALVLFIHLFEWLFSQTTVNNSQKSNVLKQ